MAMTLRTRLVLLMTLAAVSGVVAHAALTQWPVPQALAWLRVSLGLGPAWAAPSPGGAWAVPGWRPGVVRPSPGALASRTSPVTVR